MRLRILQIAIIMLALTAVFCTTCAAATSVAQFSIKTTGLIGHPAGPFSIMLALTDGTGISDGKSIVTVTSANFGSGRALGNPTLLGGASGDLASGVTITNSSFLSLFVEPFTPGEEVSFKVSLTASQSKGGFPTRLSAYILDGSGTPLATLAPAGDFFIGIDMTSEDPFPEVYGTDPSRPPFTGSAISIPTPTFED